MGGGLWERVGYILRIQKSDCPVCYMTGLFIKGRRRGLGGRCTTEQEESGSYSVLPLWESGAAENWRGGGAKAGSSLKYRLLAECTIVQIRVNCCNSM